MKIHYMDPRSVQYVIIQPIAVRILHVVSFFETLVYIGNLPIFSAIQVISEINGILKKKIQKKIKYNKEAD